MRWVFRIFLVLLALLLAAPIGGYFWLRQGLAPFEGTIALPGLERPVRIVRDAHSVPHIEAESARDAYFALGVLHAQERLFQMEFQRRAAAGRLAELIGRPVLGLDRLMRTLDLRGHAERSLELFDPEVRDKLQAYADGVNAWLENRSGPLPPEMQLLWHTPEPWEPADSVAFVKLMALQLSGNWRQELLNARLAQRLTPRQLEDVLAPEDGTPVTVETVQALAPELLDALAAALPPAPEEGLGSNAWVVDATRTTTGAPVLANDPHLGLRTPGPWYLAHLSAPELNVIGGTMPGLPLVVIGRNERVAWGLTTTHSDTQDLFVERLDPDDAARYLTPDGPRAFETREEVIRIRGGDEQRLTVRRTRNGPVVSDLAMIDAREILDDSHVLSLAWTALTGDDLTVQAGFRIMTAGDWDEFVAALRQYAAPQQNVHYADIDGHIGFYAPGRVPVRAAGDGTLPVPGWTAEHDWQGLVPFEELPQALSPPSGVVFNANNRVVDDDYPHLITRQWPPSVRARRIAELLAPTPHDPADSTAMQQDEVSLLARDFVPVLLDLVEGEELDERAARAAVMLAAWDGDMAAELPEPLIFAAWYEQVRRHVYADELGPLFGEMRGLRPAFLTRALTERQIWCNDIGTPRRESCGEQVAAALRAALEQLDGLYGADIEAWRWGSAHVVAMDHEVLRFVPVIGPLAGIAHQSGGHGSTLNALHTTGDAERPFVSRMGPTLRMVVDLADPERSRFIATTGQSGHPLSPHYRDHAQLWREGAYLPMVTDPARYREGSLGTLTLQPR